jgi:hypothetical protein
MIRSNKSCSRVPFYKAIFALLFILVLTTNSILPVSAGSNVWTSNGPEGGTINALAIDPAILATLYAGTYGGGVFKSTNSGGSWKVVNAAGETRIGTQATTPSRGPISASVHTAPGVWEIVSSPTTNSLWSLDFSSPTSGWAGGDKVLLHYNGTLWQTFSVPGLGTDYCVFSISMISDTDGWLVGRAKLSHPYYEGIIFHWDGSQWNEVTPPTSLPLSAVSAVDSSHVHTVGGAQYCTPTCNDLISYAFLWNGSSWTSTPVGSHRRMTNVSMAGNSEGWMVGDEVNISTNQYKSLAMRWVNGSWQSVSVPNVFNSQLYAVSTLDANQAWAVGLFDTLMWNGSIWSVVPNYSTHGLRDVLAMAQNDAWVVGELGTILHWDGSSFVVSSNPATVYLNKVANSSPFDVWVVGESGTILHYEEASLMISGNAGVAGATLSYTDGTSKTATADGSGNYSFTVPYNWSGTVTPSLAGYSFTPASYNYTNITLDQTNQDYIASITTFADVPSSYWAYSWIERLYSAGITSGCGTNPLIYCPEQSVTRAQMAVFLERGMHGATYIPPTGSGAVFVDVSLSTWGVNWIEKLYADGITGGCLTSPLSYCPANPVTRAQMAKFLLLAKHGASYSPPAAAGIFADVPTSYWAAGWIEQLYTEGITGGCSLSPLSYCPENSVTRAQMAKFLVLTFNLP